MKSGWMLRELVRDAWGLLSVVHCIGGGPHEFQSRATRPLSSKLGGAGASRGEWGRKMKLFTAALVTIVFFLFVRYASSLKISKVYVCLSDFVTLDLSTVSSSLRTGGTGPSLTRSGTLVSYFGVYPRIYSS